MTARALDLYDKMVLCRALDEKTLKLSRQNKGGTFHISTCGHEMVGVLAALHMQPGSDFGLPYYRDRGFAIGFGADLVDLIGTAMGRATKNHSGGRMMPEHFSDPGLRLVCQSSVVGSQFLHAAGVAKSIQLKKTGEVVYVSGGDGSTSQGEFHEALNFSALHKLPVIFSIQDNGWAISVPTKDQTAGGDIATVIKSYPGLKVLQVDGCDFEALDQAIHEAVASARAGNGPAVIISKVPRLLPHSSSDDHRKYKSEEDISKDLERDPITQLEIYLESQGVTGLAERKASLYAQIEAAADKAEAIPFPEPASARERVFAPASDAVQITSSGEPVVMIDAINHALHEAMREHPEIIVFGQDVAAGKGGVFGATRGLTDAFGPERCFNSPLAEATIIGVAVGMALSGYHLPVVEIQFADYLWTGINQLFNEVSSIYYRSDGKWRCPLVIRMPCGGYIQGGPYHSQSIEGFLAHCPGLKIALPSNAADAKALLKSAIEDPNPCIMLEHKGLYRQRFFSAMPEPTADSRCAFGHAHRVQEGEDLTVIAWGMLVPMAKEAAAKLSGATVEIIDIRTPAPLDIKTIIEAVKKTGKVLIAGEAPVHVGLAAEIAALISENCFEYLDAAPVRIGAFHSPVPYSKGLEEAILPKPADVLAALEKLARY